MERQRRGAGGSTPSHHNTGASLVPNYRLIIKGSASKQSESIILAGGFPMARQSSLSQNSERQQDLICFQHKKRWTRASFPTPLTNKKPQQNHHAMWWHICFGVSVVLLWPGSLGWWHLQAFWAPGSGKLVTRERYIPVHTIAREVGNRVIACLPAANALTGRDTTNALFQNRRTFECFPSW